MHSGKPKLDLRCKRRALSGLEGLLDIVGLDVMAEGISANAQQVNSFGGPKGENFKCRSCHAETAGAKRSSGIWDDY